MVEAARARRLLVDRAEGLVFRLQALPEVLDDDQLPTLLEVASPLRHLDPNLTRMCRPGHPASSTRCELTEHEWYAVDDGPTVGVCRRYNS